MKKTQIKLADKNPKADDVRMRGFKKRSPVEDVITWLDQQSIDLPEQRIPLQEAAGRVLAADATSQFNIPHFERSMMDGYAIVASATQGASSYNQLQLQVIGKSMPGQGSTAKVTSKSAVRIMTGAPIPDGANAVLPAENIEIDDQHIMIMESVAEGRNIGRIGEDITAGSIILKKGRRLRAQDIALLASIGEETVSVLKKPRISIAVTGNEILEVGEPPKDYQIINSNGPMLEVLCNRDGANTINSRIIPDNPELIKQAMLDDYDILLLIGGTSVGEEDLAPLLLAEAGDLAIHGIAMRPSRSTGMGTIGHKLVFLLPGNPVACLCAYDFFAGRFIRQLSGHAKKEPYRSVRKKLKQKMVSMIGRTDYARVCLSGDFIKPIAISGAAILSSTTQADGFVIIPTNSEGYPPETEVDVFLYD
ncbi:MAG: molybdopterin molybdotransferase MoeA [Methylococcales bacterium]|nr:molybdopterin molybdotransferase MoeA [Methylococcales bacterium]